MSDSYPEHEKVRRVQSQSNLIGEFLDWLRYEKNFRICELNPEWGDDYLLVHLRNEELLADFFEIDLKKLSDEKETMYQEIRAARQRHAES